MIITVTNAGPDVLSSSYWGSEYDHAGKLYASCNGGAVRLLLPRALRAMPAQELVAARHAVLSRGPWPEAGLAEAVEIMWEDGTDSPYAMHLSVESFDVLPAEPDWSRDWIVTTWYPGAGGEPEKRSEHRCYWRRSPRLPDLRRFTV